MPEIVSYQRACGVDVSKDTLDGHLVVGDTTLSFQVDNTPQGIARDRKTGLRQEKLARGGSDVAERD